MLQVLGATVKEKRQGQKQTKKQNILIIHLERCRVITSMLSIFFWERIIVPLDQPSGQLKSTSPGLYWLPYFVYTSCRCRRKTKNNVLSSTPAGTLFYTGIPAEEGAGVEEGASVEDVSLV